jgi:hypothetical protein
LTAGESEHRDLRVFRFLEGSGPVEDRAIDATYDSAGHPMSLVMLVHRISGETVVTEGLGVQFVKGDKVAGLVFSPQPDTARSHSSKTGAQSSVGGLTMKELPHEKGAAALRLANWLWEHRCGKS